MTNWFNGCDRTAVAALRYVAKYGAAVGGEQLYNSMHLEQIADELERSFKNIKETPRPPKLSFSEVRSGEWIGRPYPYQFVITWRSNKNFLCHFDGTEHETLGLAQAHAQKKYEEAHGIK